MSYCEDSNINKSYIVQPLTESDIFSACTEIYLTNITPCTGDTINISSNLNVGGNISGTTFYGDGSQLSGIITTDNYVTGGVYSASTKSLYFTGTTGFTPFSVDVSALLDDTNNYVTGGTYNPSTDTISLFRNDNVTIDISGVTDTFTTGGTYDNNTSLITFVKNDGNSYTVDLSSIDVNDTFVTGSTLFGDSLTIKRNDGVDIVVTGFSQTFTGNTSGTCIGDIYVSNIHSCSPLHINPNDEGNVYFGSNSGVTIDVINSKLGINTITPSESLDVVGNTKISGSLNIGVLGTGTSVNNLGIDSNGNIVVGTTGDTDTNTFVTGGTLSGVNLILEKNNGIDVNPINLNGLVSGKTDLTLFDSHTGDTNNPHQTSFSNLISTAHTHTISEVINLQTELDSKLNISDFNPYSGNVQTQIDNKLDNSIFVTYTGNTQSLLDTKISGGTNLSSEGVFAQKNGLNLEFKGLTSTGGTVNISSNSNTVNLEVLFPTDQNTFVTGLTFNPSTYDLTIKQNNGEPDLTSNLSVLATDVYVVSGVYDVSTGVVTYTNSSGGTFQVSGFTTGMTDSYTTAANLNGETIEFDNNIQGSNLYSVSLTPILSGKTDLTLFNTHTGDTNNPHQTSFNNLTSTAHTHTISDVTNLQTELDSKTNLTLFNTHTGDTNNPHQTSFNNLISTAHTHTLSEITDFNSYSGSVQTQIDSKLNITDFDSYSGSVQTQLDTKIENGINSGGANEIFSGKSGTDLYFRTLSGGSNTIITTVDDIIKVDVSVPVDTNSYVTGFTYDDINTFTISRNNGLSDLTSSISVLSGITYYGDGSNLSGISTDNFYVTGGTYNSNTLTLNRNDGASVVVTGFTSGSGTTNFVTKWTGSDTQGDSLIYDNGTNIGIGTNTPSEKLEVNGHIKLTGIDGGVTRGYIKSPSGEMLIGQDVGGFYVGTGLGINPALPIYYGNTGTTLHRFNVDGVNNKVRINSTGLSIDETSPSAQLHVTPTSSLSTHEVAKFGTVEVRGDGRLLVDKGTSTSTFLGDTNGVGEFNCTAVGFQAGNALVFASSNNTLIGTEAGKTITNVNNVGVGFRSLQSIGSSFQNTAVGNETLRLVSTGDNNTAFGFRAGTYIGTGTTSLTSADNSLFLGNQTRANGNGETNQIVIGYDVVGLGSNTTRIGNDSTTLTRLEGQLQLDDVPTGTSVNNLGIDSSGNVIIAESYSDTYISGGTFSSETLTLNRNDGASVVVTGFTSQPALNNGQIFVGDTGNTAQSVAMTGDVNIDNTGVTTIQPNSVTYDKIQDVSQASLLGSTITSGGTVEEIPYIEQYISDVTIQGYLSDTSNWTINGSYTGTTITGTFQGQSHYDDNYWYTAVNDNVWIRLIRG